MAIPIDNTKRTLRHEVAERLKAMSGEQLASASAQARARLAAQARWQAARSVLFYAPMAGELDVWPLLVEALAAGKCISLPRFDPERQAYVACEIHDLSLDVTRGHFSIREPAGHCAPTSRNGLDLILVPGVAFDRHGHRLGRGKGYYDQLLAAARGAACGVAFDQQIVREVPVAPHDIDMNCIVTPTRWIELEQRAVLE